jgi:hypothetical protein
MSPQGMFRFYASLPFLILGAIIIVAIVKIILEKVTGKYGKSNKINRTIDISKCPIQTLETILDQCNNIHKAIRINSEMLFYIDEYNMYLIMFKNWIGNVQGEPKDLKWYIKSTQDYRVNNAYIELKEKLNIVKFKINNDDIIPILLLNGLLIFNMSDPEIETIRMDNILDRINRKAYQKKYSEEQINEIAELLCKEMSKGLH